MTETVDCRTAAARLRGADKVLILCHKNPDGDTVGSAGALCKALQSLGRTAAVLCSDPIPKMYDYMNIATFDGSFTPAFVVAVDVASIQLFGEKNNVQDYAAHVQLCIDHHSSNSGYAYETLVDGTASATCELLVELLDGRADILFCEPPALLMLALLLVACEVLLQGTWMTVCVRGKLGKWWRNTLIYQLLHVLCRGLRIIWRGTVAAVRAIPLVWRTVLGGTALAFLSVILLGNGAGGLFLLLSLLLIAAAGAAALQLQKLRKGGQALAAGDLSYKVDTHRMFWDFRRHGEDLNAIGRGMRIAVEDQLKSERLKTELITNISHDIKTPLTSIINYVDLLQKDHTPAQEHAYLLVLDRQARKLKKLTEDLVELSKAASGNLPCRPSRRNVRELIEQAVGEYSERLADAGLTPVVTLPEEELTCHADGALMWRVLDNLLSNACKYAQTGTRLYVDVRKEGGFACFSFKNVSRDPLNVPAEELMERFVRGDSARSSEGSGLGLNIAGSLVELQGGQFRLFVDGDLFKAEFTVPLAGPSEENAPRNA